MTLLTDDFNGDDARLVECIEALLDLDASGTLFPHGVGGHARALLSTAGARLASLDATSPRVLLDQTGQAQAPKTPSSKPYTGAGEVDTLGRKDFRTPEAKKWPDDFIPPDTCGSIDAIQNALEHLRDANSQLRHVARQRAALTPAPNPSAGEGEPLGELPSLSEAGIAVGRFAIEVEKLLLAKLGRPWTSSGISIESLVDDLARLSCPSAGEGDWPEREADLAYVRNIREQRLAWQDRLSVTIIDRILSRLVPTVEGGRGLSSGSASVQQGAGDGHASDCATHNEPAMPNGACDCGAGK